MNHLPFSREINIVDSRMNRQIFRYCIVAFLAAALLAGCVATKYFPAEGAKRYPPTKEVKIFRSTPEGKYEILGIVTAEGMNENKLLEKLKTKAMSVGADGLILRRARRKGHTYASERRTEFTTHKVVYEAIAIKWKGIDGKQ